MASVDHHDKAYDRATLTKLDLFAFYAEKWIPTFVMRGSPEIHIFDFFAGCGYDLAGKKGSPIRLIEQIEKHRFNIYKKKTKIILHLNELDETKLDLLKKACNSFEFKDDLITKYLEIKYYQKDTAKLFNELLPLINRYPSLVYLDQNGVKFAKKEYLYALEKSEETDFLFFVSSSYLWRLGKTKEFKQIFPDLSVEKLKKEKDRNRIHEYLTGYLRGWLPMDSKLKLYHFSLKKDKGDGIYGVIFGAKHVTAVCKFLEAAWKINKVNGNANFDIDGDETYQGNLFFPKQKILKIDRFKQNVRKKILDREIIDNFALFYYTLDEGHIPQHAREEVISMKKEKLITYDNPRPLISYDKVHKERERVVFKVLKK